MGYPYSSGDVLTATDLNISSGLVRVFEGAISGTTYSVNNCFSSTFSNYRIVLSELGAAGSSSVTFDMRLRTTSDDTTANYAWSQYGHFGATPFNGGANSDSSAELATISTVNNAGASFDVIGPNKAGWTTGGGVFVTYQTNVGAPTLRQSAFFKGGATQYTGISFLCSQSLSGTIRIYGYGQA